MSETRIIIHPFGNSDGSLTPSEREVVLLCAEGISAKEVAARRICAVKTVDAILCKVRKKWNARNGVQVLLEAIKRGYVTITPVIGGAR